ncbi:hypothetical protein ACFE04_023107 [Oxalis oulophora]
MSSCRGPSRVWGKLMRCHDLSRRCLHVGKQHRPAGMAFHRGMLALSRLLMALVRDGLLLASLLVEALLKYEHASDSFEVLTISVRVSSSALPEELRGSSFSSLDVTFLRSLYERFHISPYLFGLLPHIGRHVVD